MSTPGKRVVAYCVLAHDRPSSLRRLVDQLASPHAEIFVHIDAKSSLQPFTEALRGTPADVHVVKRRVDVRWGGYSMVEASRAASDEALRRGPFRYVVLLSNACFPCRARDEIEDFFAHEEREFCDVQYPLAGHRFEPWVHRWNLPSEWFPGLPLESLPRYAMRYALRLGPRRELPEGLRAYKGSMWWALSRACLQYIGSYMDRHPAIERHFRFTHCSDETLYQTLLMASPFRTRLAVDLEHLVSARDARELGVHFIDWSRGGPSPKVLTLDDYERISWSSSLFVRKVVDPDSTALVDKLASDPPRLVR
jgi:hypothetical protein